MGKLIIFARYYFFIWAGENKSERLHIHVYRRNSRNAAGAKIWLDDLSIFERGDFNEKEINQILKDLRENLDLTKVQVDRVLRGEKVAAVQIIKKGKRS